MKREKLSTTEGRMAEEYKRAWKGMFVGREVRYREAWTSSMSGLSIIRSSWPFCIRVSDYSSPTERDSLGHLHQASDRSRTSNHDAHCNQSHRSSDAPSGRLDICTWHRLDHLGWGRGLIVVSGCIAVGIDLEKVGRKRSLLWIDGWGCDRTIGRPVGEGWSTLASQARHFDGRLHHLNDDRGLLGWYSDWC